MRALALLPLLALAACSPKTATQVAQCSPPLGEGRLAVPGGHIWYKVSGTGHGMPLVLVHGGPGFSSFYLKPLEAVNDDRIVIRYDQLGAGKSDRISDTTMMNIPHFVAELDSLRSFFGCQKWDVLGQSWGTILSLEYYRAHPEHVASLIFSSPVFDVPAVVEHAQELLKTLPDSTQREIKKAEATHNYDSPGYQNAINQFYALYVYRHPVEADLDSLFSTANEQIYNYMQGPSEFTVPGTLKDYVVTNFLPKISVPTLYVVGEYDEVGPALVKHFADLTPHAQYAEIPGAAHITMWDNPEANVKVVRDFLRGVDSATAN